MKFSMPVSGRHWHLLSELSSSTNSLEIIPSETPPISVMFSCIKIYPKSGGMFNVYEYWLADSSNWGMKKWGWWLIATDATLQAWVLWHVTLTQDTWRRRMWLWQHVVNVTGKFRQSSPHITFIPNMAIFRHMETMLADNFRLNRVDFVLTSHFIDLMTGFYCACILCFRISCCQQVAFSASA